MSTPINHFIVVYDDEDCLHLAMMPDRDCEGAICCAGSTDSIALFSSRDAAMKAIRISTKFSELCKAQGKPANEDFTTGRKNLRIVKCALIK